MGFPSGSDGKEFAHSAEYLGLSLGWEDSLEKGVATHISIFAGEMPRTVMPGGLPSMGSYRFGHD